MEEKKFIQIDRGPIGARLTMAVARIVMQDWKDNFKIILENSQIAELLIGLYVDDGQSLQRLLVHGERFSEKDSKIVMMEDEKISDEI